MALRDEDLKLNIIVNGDNGKKELGDLERATRELLNQNKELRLEQQRLKRAGQEGGEEFKRNKAIIEANTASIQGNEARMKELRNQIGLTGLTMKQLRAEQTRLKQLMDSATYGTPQWKMLNAELQKVEAQMHKVRHGSTGVKEGLGRVADGFSRFAVLGASVVATLAGITIKIKDLIKGNAQLSDAFADVQKTTGLTNAEVKKLYSNFKYIDTRTPRKELLELAHIAGKLGIEGSKNVEGFVKAADKINVALSEDLGGNAEEAIKQVGKIVDIFKVKEQFGIEEGMLKVGSAINALGAASTASEQYLVEFTNRVGGIAPNANISAADVLGLAATLDQLGQTAEVSSTVFGKLMVAIGKDVPYYAGVAGMSIEEFSKLLREDTNEAMLRVLDGAKSTTGGIQGMVEALGDMGVDGQRSASVIGVLTNNVDLLRKQQKLSNEEFNKGTSLTNEFNIKNETLGASLEKIGKRIHSIFVSGTLVKALEKIVKKTADFIELPVEKKFLDEQREVYKLVNELTNANTQEDRRRQILNTLNEINPKIVKGLNAENIELSTLRENLKLYNLELSNKIILANLEKDEQKIAAGLATARVKLAEEELNVFTRLKNNRFTEDIALSTGTTVEKLEQAIRKFKEIGAETIWLEQNLEKLKKLQDNVTKKEESAIDFTNRIAELKKILGIIEEINTTGKGGGGGSGDDETEVTKKKHADLYAQLEKLHNDWIRSKMDKEQQEVEAVKDKYAKLITEAKGNAELIKSIEAQRENELADLSVKHEEQRQAEKNKIIEQYEASRAEYLKKYQKLTLEEQHQAEIDELDKKYADAQLLLQQNLENELITKQQYDEQVLLLHETFEQGFQNIEDYYRDIDLQKQIAHEEARNKILEEFGLIPRQQKTQEEFDKLKAARDKDLITEEEYQKARLLLMNKANAKRLADSKAAADAVTEAVTTAKDFEISLIEDKAAEQEEWINQRLARGKISEEQAAREKVQIQANLEEDKKDIMKKYADIEFAAKISQILTSTALAVMQALAQLGPIAGAIAATAIGVTGGIQLAQATMERNKVKQLKGGKYDVIGADDGKLYKNVPYIGNINKTGIPNNGRVYMGNEEGGEIVIPRHDVQNLQLNYPALLNALYAVRTTQHADGSYPENIQPVMQDNTQLINTIAYLASVTNRLNDKLNNLQAYISYDHLKEKTNLMDSIEEEMSL